MNKNFYIGVDMPTAADSSRKTAIMRSVFKNIRNEIHEAENSGHYSCTAELQLVPVESHDFICNVLSGLGYNVKIMNNDVHDCCIVISWEHAGDENV